MKLFLLWWLFKQNSFNNFIFNIILSSSGLFNSLIQFFLLALFFLHYF